jgi:hypothetical protein
MQFLKSELNVLGRVVDDNGIHMVDMVLNWKTPTDHVIYVPMMHYTQ